MGHCSLSFSHSLTPSLSLAFFPFIHFLLPESAYLYSVHISRFRLCLSLSTCLAQSLVSSPSFSLSFFHSVHLCSHFLFLSVCLLSFFFFHSEPTPITSIANFFRSRVLHRIRAIILMLLGSAHSVVVEH